MKNCILTDLDILTPSITEQIVRIVNSERELLTVTARYGDYKTSASAHNKFVNLDYPESEKILYDKYMVDITKHYKDKSPLLFHIYQMREDLEAEIYSRLPDGIKNMMRPPYVRLQTISGGDYITPHKDTDRSITLITTISNGGVNTWFWKMTEQHPFAYRTIPDINKIEKNALAITAPGETWVFDTSSIHSVERDCTKEIGTRITINYSWTLTTMDDVLRALL